MAEGSQAAEVAASFDAMFGGISLQTLLLDHTLHLPIDSLYPPPFPLSLLPPPPLSFTDHYPSDSAVTSSSIALKPPKPEPLYISDEPTPAADQLSPVLLPPVNHAFHTAHPTSDSVGAAVSHFRRKHSTRTTAFKPATLRAATSRNNLMARQRRRRISEKMKCLKKLMPWNRKMDTATLLEEAHKYILFLEAQVSAIHSMPVQADEPLPLQYHPVDDDYQVNDYSATADDSVGFVRPAVGLNRQQALQVVVNSPAAQSVLYSQGQCVVSEEQMDIAAAATMPRHQQQEEQSLMMMMMMFDSSSSASSFYY